jgi:hypothetical protein
MSLDSYSAIRAVYLAALYERALLVRFAAATRARFCASLALAEYLPALDAVAVEDV